MQILNVAFNNIIIGQLSHLGQKKMQFQYASSWLAHPHAVPISLALPLKAEPFDETKTRAFFANLLPEGKIRQRLARILNISAQNDFDLLTAIAGETAGAISLHVENSSKSLVAEKFLLTTEELNKLLILIPRQPFLLGHPSVRLTLSGAQNKLPIHVDGNKIYLPHANQLSTHILKPALMDFPAAIENEWFCMKLARSLGLPVPTVNILRAPAPLYIIKRYDRQCTNTGAYTCLHQEDFCQAAGLLPEQKYESAGGLTLPQCFQLIRTHSRVPAQDLTYLLHWAIFNFLIGNADGHGKNIAFLFTENGARLAPFYDLMSTAVYPELTNKLAMNIGGEDDPEKISIQHWKELAKQVGIRFSYVQQAIEKIAGTITLQAEKIAQTITANAILKEVQTIIQQRIQLLT